MKRIKLALTAATLSLIAFNVLLDSCKVSKSSTYDYMNVSKTGVFQKPQVADIEISDNKLTLTKTYNKSTIPFARDMAMADFLRENHCDVIINPQYDLDATGYMYIIPKYGAIKITLTGYAGTYKNIHNYQSKDEKSFELLSQLGDGVHININRTEDAPPTIQSKPTKK